MNIEKQMKPTFLLVNLQPAAWNHSPAAGDPKNNIENKLKFRYNIHTTFL